MRRNLLIAGALEKAFAGVNILMLTGAREAAAFRFPDGVDAVTLPALHKEANDRYRSRLLRLQVEDLIAMRSRLIRATIEAFAPDLFIVDKVARGTMQELEDALSYLCAHTDTRCVLGLRDILDRPDIVHDEWRRTRHSEAVTRYYDAVWVYGDPGVYETAKVYAFPDEIASKVAYTGYLDPTLRLVEGPVDATTGALLRDLGDRFFMCAVGGGQDGRALAERFAGASFPAGVSGLIVTGPHMPDRDVQVLLERTRGRPHLRVIQFCTEPLKLYAAAERVVSMGGYNTICELMALRKKALIVPRIFPREEQWIRARRLQALGLLDVMHPADVTPQRITAWFNTPADLSAAPDAIDLQGLDRIPELVERLLARPPLPQISSEKNTTDYVFC